MKKLLLIPIMVLLTGCVAGSLEYYRPYKVYPYKDQYYPYKNYGYKNQCLNCR